MSAKKKSKNPSSGSSLFRKIGIALIAVVISVGLGLALTGKGSPPDRPDVIGGEKRQTMSPGYFVGKTSKAYKVARDIPQVLDKIYCYCRCQDNYGHKSLLTCFVDRHGSQCGICMDEALMAYDLHKKGYSADDIVAEVDSVFSRKRH